MNGLQGLVGALAGMLLMGATTMAAPPASVEAQVSGLNVGAAATPSITAGYQASLKRAAEGIPLAQVQVTGKESAILDDHTMAFGSATAPPGGIGTQTTSVCSLRGQTEYRQLSGKITLSEIRCSGLFPPKPASITVTWWEAPLTSFSSTPRVAAEPTTIACDSSNNNCIGRTFDVNSHSVTRTSAIFPTVRILDTRGNSRQDQWANWYYNDVGTAYPYYTDTRGNSHLIPFRIPDQGWNRCEDTGRIGGCDRVSWFRDRVIDNYNSHGWSYQTAWEAHHVAQVSKGGGNNSYTVNGVMLPTTQHDYFTYRWEPQFIPRNF